MIAKSTQRPRERLTTGVPGLDAVLDGGFLRFGVYIVQGKPGAGKTILANQFCFHHAANGGRVLYVTLLAETHERMLFNLEQLAFFDSSLVADQVSYLSAFSNLEEEGLKGLIELLRREARSRKITLLVIDGIIAVEETAQTKNDFKKFIHELQIHATLVGCTILLLTTASTDSVGPEHTMVDGVVEVVDRRIARFSERELEVTKFRGSAYLRGGHAFRITREGIDVYPRIESLLQDPSPEDPCPAARVSTGMPSLDAALHGGLPCGTGTVMFGPTGSGKTTVGLHFLNDSRPSGPGLHFGFYETPARIVRKAKALGFDFEAKQKERALELLWHPPTERMLDALGHRLLSAVRERGVKRVLLDGIDGLLKAAVYPDRLTHFLTAVTNELRLQGATTMYSVELPDLFSTQVALPMQGISSLLENVFLFRFVEQNSELRRLFTIVKLRDSNYDGTLRELRITSHGAELAEPLGSETSGTTGKSARSLGKVGATKAASRKRRLKLRARKA